MAGHARTLLQRLGLRNPQGSCGAFFDGWNSGLAEPLQFRLADPTMPRAVPAQPQAPLTLAMQGVRQPMLGILRGIILLVPLAPSLPAYAHSAACCAICVGAWVAALAAMESGRIRVKIQTITAATFPFNVPVREKKL